MRNKIFRFFALLGVVMALSLGAAGASEPDTPSTIVTNASGLLTSIYPIVIGAVSFGILISLVKMVRRK